MALPSTGPISLLDARTELGQTGAISLNDGAVRQLATKGVGAISMYDLYGKTKPRLLQVTEDTPRIATNNSQDMGGVITGLRAGDHVIVEIMPGVRVGELYLYTRSNSIPITITLINRGIICYWHSSGAGGRVIGGYPNFSFSPASPGQEAIRGVLVHTGSTINVENYGVIAASGGGGGSIWSDWNAAYILAPGGGGMELGNPGGLVVERGTNNVNVRGWAGTAADGVNPGQPGRVLYGQDYVYGGVGGVRGGAGAPGTGAIPGWVRNPQAPGAASPSAVNDPNGHINWIVRGTIVGTT